MDEVWKPVPGFDDYAVSNTGKVASMKKGWLLLRPLKHNRGYLMAGLYKNKVEHRYYVHTLVAEAFLGSRPTPLHETNHVDGDKANNSSDNLEWTTPKQNIRHSFDVLGNKAARGEKHGKAKLTEAQVREIRTRRASGESIKSLKARFDVSGPNITNIANGKYWAWFK